MPTVTFDTKKERDRKLFEEIQLYSMKGGKQYV